MNGSILLIANTGYQRDRSTFDNLITTMPTLFNEVNVVSMSLANSPIEQDGDGGRRPNTWSDAGGVRSLEWRGPWSPSGEGRRFRDWLAKPAVDLWAAWPCTELDAAARRANVIVVQSGPGVALLARLRRCAPNADIIYVATALLAGPGLSQRLQARLERDAGHVDRAVVVARAMIPRLPMFGRRIVFAPQAFDRTLDRATDRSPYGTGSKTIAVLGSAPFDASVIQIAATSYPDTHFHLIDVPAGHRFPANVTDHGILPRVETISCVRHADLGVAAFADEEDASFLADSSPQLATFDHVGLPVVCPLFAVGESAARFGYEPGRSASVRDAFERALRSGLRKCPVRMPSWLEVARLVLGLRPGFRENPAVAAIERRTAHAG